MEPSSLSSDSSPDPTPDEGDEVETESIDDTPDTTTPSDEVPDEGADEDSTPSIQSSPAFRVAAISTQEEAMPTVTELQDNDNTLIRKHGNQLFAIADYDTPAIDIDDLFGERDDEGFLTPKALPAGWKVMGFISTDGITDATDVSMATVNAVQTLSPVRNDVDAETKTLQLSFLERSAYTAALAHDLPVSEWPASKKSPYQFHDGDKSDYPYYRGLVISQDKVGKNAWYRVEEAYMMQVSDKGDRNLQRSDVEETNRTFTCFPDPGLEITRSYTEDSRPAYIAPAAPGTP